MNMNKNYINTNTTGNELNIDNINNNSIIIHKSNVKNNSRILDTSDNVSYTDFLAC